MLFYIYIYISYIYIYPILYYIYPIYLRQNIYRKVQQAGLQTKYQEDANFSVLMRMIDALAPTEEVESAFYALSDIMLEEGTDKLNYFEDTYIGRQIRRTRRAPLFQLSLRNIHNRTIEDLPRTNNIVEAWHRRSSSFCGCSHPQLGSS